MRPATTFHRNAVTRHSAKRSGQLHVITKVAAADTADPHDLGGARQRNHVIVHGGHHGLPELLLLQVTFKLREHQVWSLQQESPHYDGFSSWWRQKDLSDS